MIFRSSHPQKLVHIGGVGAMRDFGRGLFILVLLLLQASGLFAQNEKRVIDSISRQIKVIRADTTRVDLYWRLAENFKEINPDTAIIIATEGYKLAEKINAVELKGKLNMEFAGCYKKKSEYKTALGFYQRALSCYKELPDDFKNKNSLVAKAYDGIGVIYHSVLDDKDSAVIFHTLALKLFEGENDTSKIAEEYTELANICFDKGEYKNAISYHYQALKLLQQKKSDKLGIANTSLNIGNVCSMQGDYVKARQYMMSALGIFESMLAEKKDDRISNAAGNCLFSIAGLYIAQKQYDSASIYYEKSLALYKESDFKEGEIATLSGIGQVSTFNRDYQKALENYFRALTMLQELDIKSSICATLGNIGEAYLAVYNDTGKTLKTGSLVTASKSANLSKAIEYLTKALTMAKEQEDKESVKEFSQYLSEAYKHKGDYKNAYESYLLFAAAKDTLSAQDAKKQLLKQETEAHKEILDKETKLNLLTIEKNKNEAKFLYVGMALLLFIIGLVVRSNMKQNKSNKIITKEKKRSDELLLNILPAEVAEELKDKGSAEAKYFQEVTVFFSDFVGFTKVSERMTPQQLVNELDACFKGFDHIMTKYNIEKIKTVGDAYLAVSGLPMGDPNHAEKIVKAALEIRDFQLERKRLMGDMTFEVRIGAHSGSVVAGIVGVKKFAYDIWGDTVNTAARMEQNSMPGRVNISEDTYQRVKDKFSCEFRGKIQAKNKGELSMYFVNNSTTEDA